MFVFYIYVHIIDIVIVDTKKKKILQKKKKKKGMKKRSQDGWRMAAAMLMAGWRIGPW